MQSLPTAPKNPASQRQRSTDSLRGVLKDLNGHGVQAGEDSGLQVSAGHIWQSDKFVAPDSDEFVPAGQGRQISVVAPVSPEYLPDAQSVQPDDPLSGSYFPGRQASQTSDELAPEFALAVPGSQA